MASCSRRAHRPFRWYCPALQYHWGEVVCGINLGAPCVLEMRNAK